jgi:hypothetical protein
MKFVSNPLTLILDEADTFFADKSELRGQLNSSYQRGGASLSCVAKSNGDYNAHIYRGFVPVAILGIGSHWWWPALKDRSFVIELEKAKGIELPEFDPDDHKDLQERLVAWGKANVDTLKAAKPTFPPGIEHRNADKWRPLLAIADLAGGEWPVRAREVVQQFCGQNPALMERVQGVFNGADELTSEELAEALGLDGPIQLAQMLKPYGIEPKRLWFEGKQLRGYKRKWFVTDVTGLEKKSAGPHK